MLVLNNDLLCVVKRMQSNLLQENSCDELMSLKKKFLRNVLLSEINYLATWLDISK